MTFLVRALPYLHDREKIKAINADSTYFIYLLLPQADSPRKPCSRKRAILVTRVTM
jgi:hypothetical protein